MCGTNNSCRHLHRFSPIFHRRSKSAKFCPVFPPHWWWGIIFVFKCISSKFGMWYPYTAEMVMEVDIWGTKFGFSAYFNLIWHVVCFHPRDCHGGWGVGKWRWGWGDQICFQHISTIFGMWYTYTPDWHVFKFWDSVYGGYDVKTVSVGWRRVHGLVTWQPMHYKRWRSEVKVMTQKRDPSRAKYVILCYISESHFTANHSAWACACVDDTWLCWWQFVSLVRQWSQSCRLESRQSLLMLADVNSVNTNDCRKSDVSCCRVLRFRMADVWGRPEPAAISGNRT